MPGATKALLSVFGKVVTQIVSNRSGELSETEFFELPMRLRATLPARMSVRVGVGEGSILMPPALEVFPWRPHWMTDLLARALPGRDGAFLDVGVNRLQTYLDLRAGDARRDYFGFEPNPACAHFAIETLKRSDERASRIVPCALGAHSGILDLWLHRGQGFDPCATVLGDLRPGRDLVPQSVPVLTLDEAVAHLALDAIAMVKIDVEGGELEVLQGAADVMRRLRPLIACEVLYRDSKGDAVRHRARGERLAELVAQRGYATFRVVQGPHAVTELRPRTGFWNETWTPENADECDFVFCPVEQVGDLARRFPIGRPE